MNAQATAPTITDEILEQERAYYSAVQERDSATVARLTADECIVLGPQGMQRFDAQAAGDMAKQHDGKTTYAVDNSSVEVLSIDENTAVIAYKLSSEKPDGAISETYDTSVWVRKEDGRWACALHAEAPAMKSS